MLKFLGKGGAFSTDYGNTSAYLKRGNNMILFDCGEDVFKKLLQLDLLSGIESLTVAITHTHGDHVGSLSSLCHYMRIYLPEVVFKIVFPAKDDLVQLLTLMHVKNAEILVESENSNENFLLTALNQDHIDPSFGYILTVDDSTLFYSGDTKTVNGDAVGKLLKGEINYFYHEVAANDLGNHTSFDILRQSIPSMYRDNVYVMHATADVEERCKDLSFNIIEIEEV